MAYIKKIIDVSSLDGIVAGEDNDIEVRAYDSNLGESISSPIQTYSAEGVTYEWDSTNNYYIVTAIEDPEIKNLTINSYHPTYTNRIIGEIGANAFENTLLETITLPPTLQKIGTNAFCRSNLKSVTIPASVKEIGNSAFTRCTSLESVRIEAGTVLTTIGPHAFYACSKLAAFNLVVTGYNEDGTETKDNVIPASVKEIATNAFRDCSALTSIMFESIVNQIGNGAFQNSGITSMSMVGSGDTSEELVLGAYVFSQCKNLVSVQIAGCDLYGVPTCAFKDCSNLANVWLPHTVNWISRRAFEGCTSRLVTLIFRAMINGKLQTVENCKYGWFYTDAQSAPKQVYVNHNSGYDGTLTPKQLYDTYDDMNWFRISKMQKPYVKLEGKTLTIADTTYLADSFKVYINYDYENPIILTVNEEDKNPSGIVLDYLEEQAESTT